MARYLYDVNTLQRYIDVHKQFQGGLKTVDTDDSLKDVYLREAENVSLSEFNFIEKRYGTHKLEEHKPWTSLEDSNSPLQGYFEYYVDANTVHKIVAIEGQFYIKQGSGDWEHFGEFYQEGETFDLSLVGLENNMFQTTRTIEGVRIDDKLYIATGTYPVYYKGDGKIYVLPQYKMSDLDIYNPAVETGLGYDLNSIDLEEQFKQPEFTATSSQGFTLNGETVAADTIIIKDSLITKRFPYVNEEEPTKIKLAFHIYNNSNLNRWGGVINDSINDVNLFDSSMTEDELTVWLGNTGTGEAYEGSVNTIYGQYKESNNSFRLKRYKYVLKPTLYIKRSGALPSTYQEVIDANVFELSNDIESEPNRRLPVEQTATVYNYYENRNAITGLDSYNFFSNVMGYRTLNNTLLDPISNTLATKLKIVIPTNDFIVYATGGINSTVVFSNADGSTTSTVNLSTLFSSITYIYGSVEVSVPSFATKFNLTLMTKYLSSETGSLQSGSIYLNDEEEGVKVYMPYKIVLNNFEIDLKNLVSGYWDFKVELKLTQTGYFSASQLPLNGEETIFDVRTKTLDTKLIEISNVWVTPEELTDFKEEPFLSLKIHSCNRIVEHNGRLGLFGHPVYNDYVFFSTISAKEYFPYSYSLQFTNELKEQVNTINKFMNILVVQSDSYTWGIKGDSPFPISPLEGEIYRKITINPTIGCIAPYSVKNVRNQLYFLSKEGIFTLRALYAEDNRYNVDPIDRNIYNIVPRDTNAVAAYFDDQYWLHFPNSGDTLRYYVDKKAWVKDTYTPFNIFGGIFKYINESGKLRFITKLSQLEESEAFKIFDIEVDYSLPTDLTKNIVSKFTTSFLNQNYPFHLKNYKEAKFDFAIQNEYNTSNENLPVSNYAENSFYVQFDVDLIDRHVYSLTLLPTEVITPSNYVVEIDDVEVKNDGVIENSIPGSTLGNLTPITFTSNKTGKFTVKITIYELGFPASPAIITSNISENSIKLYDATYDHTVTFNTLVLSEEGTLNIDPIDSYTEADVQIPIDLGTRTGNWTFGTSNFGNVIVAVKTVKLAGRGYNNKVSVIEDSKSKWTLESLGITYKMKKARSR